MSPGLPVLRFAWWNVQSFAHFDPNRAGEERWPLEPAEYRAKCDRVDAALRHLIAQHEPDILGLCEVTPTAAEELRQRLLPDYNLIYPDPAPGAEFQVAVLFRRSFGFRDRLPLLGSDVPRTTRGMPVIDHTRAGHCIRFIFCHWTAFGENSQVYRERLAEAVSAHAYEFVTDKRRTKTNPHVVIVGDLNEEPFGDLLASRLHAFRDRERSRQRTHPSDRDTRRVRLYNAGWRLLGERHPHDAPAGQVHLAGAYFHAQNRAWHTYDQVLVTGGLIGNVPPFLEESSFGIMPLPGCLGTSGKPEPFCWGDGQASGLSDHLPLAGRIVLPPS